MGRKGVLTALKPGRLVYLIYLLDGRVYTTSRCYKIVEISEHRGAQYATLGPAAGLHPFGATRGATPALRRSAAGAAGHRTGDRLMGNIKIPSPPVNVTIVDVTGDRHPAVVKWDGYDPADPERAVDSVTGRPRRVHHRRSHRDREETHHQIRNPHPHRRNSLMNARTCAECLEDVDADGLIEDRFGIGQEPEDVRMWAADLLAAAARAVGGQ